MADVVRGGCAQQSAERLQPAWRGPWRAQYELRRAQYELWRARRRDVPGAGRAVAGAGWGWCPLSGLEALAGAL
ncbi:hypothetical protein [Nonomuraea rubra]|uniref:hypothetical protein n=1 Tax=Nonomuraea rubra TaxID=46180 RepID=UPI0034007FA0